MKTKLTLSVDKSIVEKAKKYAKSNGKSLSSIIEEYLKSLIQKEEKEFEISPLVQSLWGSVKPLPKSITYKGILEEEIVKKHLK